ncbi:DinB family protein [Paenibacillus cellulosilyticus]|uniref:DinB family protein n=1 Tax=Paenibacillus cellulosilyticus TaxID=375489 RepID=A0A2V2YW96_9BACL|nr:DinB family protein [Paenibacillus cellulosilyticus]PWW02896.1 DinB family protein [Paenibacillus cellulosilyticus]QKS45808.1 DinB family protein [Paenibacillus cellulosilyticus]
MITKQLLEQFENTANYYLSEIPKYTMEQMTRKPSEDEWSLGQMYLHLVGSALYMQLRNLELCREQESAPVANDRPEMVKAMFAAGSFPPDRIRVPASPQYTPKQPESLEEMEQGLRAVIARMRELEPTLAAIPADRAVAHPRMGLLNAQEWFALVEMHYRHHLLQKGRLDVFLLNNASV